MIRLDAVDPQTDRSLVLPSCGRHRSTLPIKWTTKHQRHTVGLQPRCQIVPVASREATCEPSGRVGESSRSIPRIDKQRGVVRDEMRESHQSVPMVRCLLRRGIRPSFRQVHEARPQTTARRSLEIAVQTNCLRAVTLLPEMCFREHFLSAQSSYSACSQ